MNGQIGEEKWCGGSKAGLARKKRNAILTSEVKLFLLLALF